MTRLTQCQRRAQQGGSSGLLTPHTSFTASQQASTMSSRHIQFRRTHRHYYMSVRIIYICPGTRGSEAAVPSVLLTGPQLSSRCSLPSLPVAGTILLDRQHSICLAPIRLSLSFPSQTRCFFFYSHAHHAYTYTRAAPRFFPGSTQKSNKQKYL